jgi:8-oxo-dGTP pyrophosphatase MutT (NUDIX family)
MEPLLILKDVNIFENPSVEPKFYKLRPTAKAIVIDDNGEIAMLSARGHSLFPGGGVKKRETEEEALIRECKEEIGCDVVVAEYLGRFDQYRAHTAKKYEVHFFVAYVIGEKGEPTTTIEKELNFVLSWEAKENVEEILEEQIENIPLDEYSAQFNARTHLAAFRKYLELHPD